MTYPLVSARITAREQGRTVIEPTDTELFIDIDSPADEDFMFSQLKVLKENGVGHGMVNTIPSRTEGHSHVVINWASPLTPMERVLLQAVLGSDRKRELLSWLRIQKGIEPVTAFFKVPPKARALTVEDSDDLPF